MSETSGPPPLIGAGAQDKDKENDVPDETTSSEEQKASEEKVAEEAAKTQEAIDKVLNEQPDQRTEPYGETSLGFSVTNVDDEEKEDADEPKTAFNSPKEDSPTPSGTESTRNWGNPLHVVNDPFEGETGSPFDKGGFVGVDPYRAVVSEVRNPDPSGDSDDDED